MPNHTTDPGQEGTTLTEVINAYRDAGFAGSFTVTSDAMLECNTCHQVAWPSDVAMSSLRRLEGASDPDDMLAVVALTCPHCGARGTTTLGFGPAASPQDSDVIAALRDQRDDDQLPANSAPGETTGDTTS